MSKSKFPALAGFLIASFLAAAIGGVATATSVGSWYGTLHKPAWNPPDWIFGPVWTLLYALMAVAAWRVWRTAEAAAARRTLRLFGVQLGLNALWSILFFGLRRPDVALAEVLVFWVCLIVMLGRFWRQDRLAGALWAPYVAWVGFASALNGTVWWLNR